MWTCCTIKLCGCIKILFRTHSFKTIMGGSIFKVNNLIRFLNTQTHVMIVNVLGLYTYNSIIWIFIL